MHVEANFITNNFCRFSVCCTFFIPSCHMNFSLKSFTICFEVMTGKKINCNYFVLFNFGSYMLFVEHLHKFMEEKGNKTQNKYCWKVHSQMAVLRYKQLCFSACNSEFLKPLFFCYLVHHSQSLSMLYSTLHLNDRR